MASGGAAVARGKARDGVLPGVWLDGRPRPGGRARRLPVVPMFVLAAASALALLAPLIAPHSPVDGLLVERLLPPFPFERGSTAHLLGTDVFGRDMLSRLIFGARVSLAVSAIAVALGGAIGLSFGIVSGYYGGRVDSIMMRTTDIALSLPLVLLAIVIAVVLGSSFLNIVLIISLLLWPRYARTIRGETLSVKTEAFVEAARVVGAPPWRIMAYHILPNVMPTFLVLATLQVGHVIILEATLSFLGVGIPPPDPTWGSMVAEGRGLIATAWWLSLFPGMAITLVVLSANWVGDWIRNRLDPKLSQEV